MQLPSVLRRWQEDKARLLRNERALDADAAAIKLAAWCSLLVLALAALAHDPATLPLLVCHSLLCWAMYALNRCAPTFCIRHREAFIAVLHLHHSWTLAVASVGRDYAHISFQGMHPPFLWVLAFFIGNGGVWMLAYTMHACLPWPLAALLLPAVVAAPLWHSPAICRRLIDSGPGFQASLAGLHRWAGIAHSAVPVPLTAEWAAGTDDPVHQCVMLNTHALLLCNVALPLLALWRAELRARRRLAAEQQRAARLQLAAGGDEEHHDALTAEQVQQALKELDTRVHWPLGKALLDAHLVSTAVWIVVVLGTLVPRWQQAAA